MNEKTLEQQLIEVFNTIQKLDADYNERKASETKVYCESKKEWMTKEQYSDYLRNKDNFSIKVDTKSSKATEVRLEEAYNRIEQLEKDLSRTREETADLVISIFHNVMGEEIKKAVDLVNKFVIKKNTDLR